jgi:hypothetical protein
MDTNFCNVSVPEVIVRLYSCQFVVFLACAPLCYHRGVGRWCGAGRGLGVTLGVAEGVGVELGVGVTVGVGVGPDCAQYLPPLFK